MTQDQIPTASIPMLEKLSKIHVFNSSELKTEMDRFHSILGVVGKLPVEPPELAFEHYHAIPLIVETGCGGACTFCDLYDRRIVVKTRYDVFRQIDQMIEYLGEELDHYRRVVLLDGDALSVPSWL